MEHSTSEILLALRNFTILLGAAIWLGVSIKRRIDKRNKQRG